MGDIYFVPESKAYCMVTLDTLFGCEVKKLNISCNTIMKNWLHEYEGCYVSPYKPKFSTFKKLNISNSNDFGGGSVASEYKKFLKHWYLNHPEEKEKEDESKKLWESQRDHQFNVVFGIAARHHIYIKWCGKCNPSLGDQFDIYKNNVRIGCIHCI